jgi:hypothetical protein
VALKLLRLHPIHRKTMTTFVREDISMASDNDRSTSTAMAIPRGVLHPSRKDDSARPVPARRAVMGTFTSSARF